MKWQWPFILQQNHWQSTAGVISLDPSGFQRHLWGTLLRNRENDILRGFKNFRVSRQRATHQLTGRGGCFQFTSLSYSLQKKLCPAGLEARQPRSSHQETLVLLTQPSVTYNHFLGPRILKWEEYCSWKHNLVVLTKWNTETESLWWTAHHYSGKVRLGIWEVRGPFPLSPRHCAREFRHSVSSNAHSSSRWVNYHD